MAIPFRPGFSRQRAAAALFLVAIAETVSIGSVPHVIYRVPLASVAAWGLWKRKRWAFPVALMAAVVWMFVTLVVLPFLLIAPPWQLWRAWLYWGIPAALVIWAVVLLISRAGREERHQ